MGLLTWTAATDNVGVSYYEVYQNDVLLGPTADLFYDITSLPNQKNFYKIVAVDAAGNRSTFSNTVICWGQLGFGYKLNLELS